jgi:predicted DNA-binding transcriptional regulator YafY
MTLDDTQGGGPARATRTKQATRGTTNAVAARDRAATREIASTPAATSGAGPARRRGPGRPAADYSQAERLFKLYTSLMRGPKTINELAAEFEVHTKTIKRDLTKLSLVTQVRDDFPRLGSEKRWGLAEEGRLNTVSVTNEQALAFLMAFGLFEPFRGTALWKHLDTVRAGFGHNLDATVSRQLGDPSRMLYTIPEPPKLALERVGEVSTGAEADTVADGGRAGPGPNDGDGDGDGPDTVNDVLNGIVTGLLRGRRVELDYQAHGRDAASKHLVDPYTLVTWRSGLYLLAHSHTARDMRLFAVERIRSATARKGPAHAYVLPPEYHPRRYFADRFGLGGSNEKPETVELVFSPATAALAGARLWHPSQTLTPLPEGALRIALFVSVSPQLVSWILEWGPGVKVEAPATLRAKVQSELAAALAQYTPAAARAQAVPGRDGATVALATC